MRRHRPTVLRLARFAYHLDESLAEDATQETFLRLQRALPGFVGKASLATYLHAIAARACLDIRREGAFRHVGREAPLDDEVRELSDPEQDPALRLALSSDLSECLKRLTERARRVILLKAVRSASYQEISSWLGIPEGTVGRIISEARSAMRKCMEGGPKKAPPVPA